MWEWGLEAAQEYAEVLRSGHERVAKALKGIYDFLGGSDMMACLSMMALLEPTQFVTMITSSKNGGHEYGSVGT